MIARVWHGWTTEANAPRYEALLREEILIGIASREIQGYHGISLLKRRLRDEVEFVTIMWFSDLEGVRAFAGTDYETAVVPPKARALLSRFDHRSAHYETVCPPASDGQAGMSRTSRYSPDPAGRKPDPAISTETMALVWHPTAPSASSP